MSVGTDTKQSKTISERRVKIEEAFKNGKLQGHAAAAAFEPGDAGGQRGWGPMMQT